MQHVCIPVGCIPPTSVTTTTRCQSGGSLSGGEVGLCMREGSLWTEWLTRFWKQYLPATLFAGGKNAGKRMFHPHAAKPRRLLHSIYCATNSLSPVLVSCPYEGWYKGGRRKQVSLSTVYWSLSCIVVSVLRSVSLSKPSPSDHSKSKYRTILY